MLINDDDGAQTYHLYDPTRDSWARATLRGARATVITHGRDLWHELHQLVTSWHEHGCPDLSRYGLTVQRDATHRLWLDEPNHQVGLL